MPGDRDAKTKSPRSAGEGPAHLAAGAVMAAALAVALLGPTVGRTRLWGHHAAAFLDTASGVGVAGVALLVALALALGRPRGLPGLILAGGGAALLFFLWRDTTHLLGDGRLWLAALRAEPAFHPHEPIAWALAQLPVLGHDRMDGQLAPGWIAARLEIWGLVLGLLALALTWRLAGVVAPASPREPPDTAPRRLAFGLMAAAGVSLLGFGYIEAYPAFWVATAALLLALLLYLEGRVGALPVGLLAGGAVAVHAAGVLLIPAVVTTGLLRRPTPRAAVGAVLAGALPVLAAYGVLPLLTPRDVAPAEHEEAWLRLLAGMNLHGGTPGAWLLEQVNRWGMSAGPAFWLLLAAPALAIGRGVDGATRVLLAAALGLTAPALLLDTEGSRGAAADWDAFAVAGLPMAAAAARLALRSPAAGARGFRALLWGVVAIGLFGTLSFAVVAHRPESAEARFRLLLTESFRTPRARSWGWETLAGFHRDRGDMAPAADAYLAALAAQPENERLLRNSAAALGRVGRSREAAHVLGRLVERAPDDASAWLRLGQELESAGIPDSAIVAHRRALALDPRSVDALNALSRLLIRTPATRAEAWALIDRSLRLAPGQRYAAELAAARARLEADGFGAADGGAPPR